MKNTIHVLLLFLFCGLSTAGESQIFINEFLASNVSINADIVDFDDYSDWIELYNSADADIDLGGYFITDDVDNPMRWEIPSGAVIPSRGYLLFWADGYDDVPGKTYTRDYYPFNHYTTKFYHLNFKLSRAGEYIGLCDPDGELVDSVSFNLQYRDVSMGRWPDGSANWVYFGEPTPNAPNSTPGVTNPERAENPLISLDSGFYTDPQTVILSASSADADIKYTLDGSRPSSLSPSYETPIPIDSTCVLRVCAFEQDKLPSEIATRTYFIDEKISLPVVSITAFPEILWDEKIGIYEHSYKNREIPIHFEFFHPDRPGFSLDAGLQLTGVASLYYPQKSFTISARERYGQDVINYQVFLQRELDQFKTLYVRNAGVPDNRSTLFRDGLLSSLVLNKMDIDCQAYLPAVVFINGEYWGIYNVRDKINSDYIASLHGVNPDDVDLLEYEGTPDPTVMTGEADNYLSFYDFVETTDLSQEVNYKTLESWMDVDEFINYYIAEIYCDNIIWLNQNVRMWRERQPDALWRWILFDTDFGFSRSDQQSMGYRNNTLRWATSTEEGAPPWSTMLFRQLLTNEVFKQKFIQRFSSCLNSIFAADTVLATIDEVVNTLSPKMPRHIERWRYSGFANGSFPITSYSAWLDNVSVVRRFAERRPDFQRQHLLDYFNLGGLSFINLSTADADMGYIEVNGFEKIRGQKGGTYFKDVPIELKAVPNVGYRFVEWEGVSASFLNPLIIDVRSDSLILTARFAPTAVNVVPAVCTSDAILRKNQSPYYALGNVHVPSGVTLTIESGVQIRMPEKASFVVNGRLKINGSADDPVTIVPNENSTSWGDLCFVDADSSVISYLKITGATRGVDFSRDRAAISAYNSNLSLDHVTVERVEAPIFTRFGHITIRDCHVTTDKTGDLINIKNAESVIVENCVLRGNSCYDSDGIDFDDISNGIVRGNRIFNFYGFNSDAIDLGEGSHDILIEGNMIYNISDKGVSIGGASTATVRRNCISNCGQGVGIKDHLSYGYLEHNTFYANRYAVACFEKNIGIGGGRADVVNCILANSTVAPVLVDALSELNISYSLSNTDELAGVHNVHAEPHFLNNFYLDKNSPIIDLGDPRLAPDADGSLPDLGAYAYDPENQRNLVINEIHYHPDNGEQYEFIELYNGGAESFDLSGCRLTGDVRFSFLSVSMPPGEYCVIAKSRSLYEENGLRVFQWESGQLGDESGSVELVDDHADLIDFVNYNSDYGWPVEPNGDGRSLELFHPSLENMVSSSWRSSYSDGGSPGRSNLSREIQGLCINEFLASNDHFQADENGEFDDWIEIYNNTENAIDLGGLYITDNLNLPCKYQIPFTEAQHTMIPANGFLLLWADGQTDQGVMHLGFKLDAAGEQIGLVQVVENDTVFIDSLSYGLQLANVSLGRSPDSGEEWAVFDFPTPLASNIVSDIKDNPSAPLTYSLSQNYPNPFNAVTTIRFSVAKRTQVELAVYDILGQCVVTLVNGIKDGGEYSVPFDASGLASGLYFYKLSTPAFVRCRKMIALK